MDLSSPLTALKGVGEKRQKVYAKLGINNVGELLDMPIRFDSSELSDEELELLTLYRKSHSLPKKQRLAMKKTLESTIELYLSSHEGRVKRAAKQTGEEK